ncbi:MAG: transporter related protein [Acidobacteriaceae bacterium]|nr:transporter related protein [Acidobacteriaceae bacterium]
MSAVPRKSWPVYRLVIAQSRSCWVHLLGIALLSLVSMPLALLSPLPLKVAVDSVIGQQPVPQVLHSLLPFLSNTVTGLALAICLLLLIALLTNLQGLFSWWLQSHTGEKLVWDFRSELLNHVQRLSMSYHDSKGAIDTAYRIQHDAPSLQYIAIQGFIPLVTASFTLIGMLVVCSRIDRSLALIALGITPVLFFLTRTCGKLVRNRSVQVRELDSSAMSVIYEVLGSIRVIKAFGQEKHEHQRFLKHSALRISGQMQLSILQATFNVLIGLTISIGTAAVMYTGVHHVQSGLLTTGELLMVMAYIAQMYEPLRLLSTKTTDLQSWLTSVERAFALLDEAPELDEPRAPQQLARARGEIEFLDVCFRYGGRSRGLTNISFHVPSGSRVGIVGATGAGKSTLLALLNRFYDPDSGRVLLDGKDVRGYRIADLRRQYSIVLQDPLLFATTIAENIAYGKPHATTDEIYAAAIAANAHEFILALPDGYETKVGERGCRLSGGERQRISLARAFLRDSPILILDEPTSSVDAATEAAIMEATETLMTGRTTFLIAHRLSTLKNCDMILRLSDGELVRVQVAEELAELSFSH